MGFQKAISWSFYWFSMGFLALWPFFCKLLYLVVPLRYSPMVQSYDFKGTEEWALTTLYGWVFESSDFFVGAHVPVFGLDPKSWRKSKQSKGKSESSRLKLLGRFSILQLDSKENPHKDRSFWSIFTFASSVFGYPVTHSQLNKPARVRIF